MTRSMTQASLGPRIMPAGRRVLIVDDEPRMRDMLLRAIADMGFEGTAAASAEAALRGIESAGSPPDILLLDLNLPRTSGMELFETIRRRWASVQVIVL